MRGRFTFRVKMARLQATDLAPNGHLTIDKSLVGAIDIRSVALIDPYQGTSTIQIAIAGDRG